MKIRFKKNSMTWVHLGVGIALLALIVPLAIIYLPSPQNYVVCAFAFVGACGGGNLPLRQNGHIQGCGGD